MKESKITNQMNRFPTTKSMYGMKVEIIKVFKKTSSIAQNDVCNYNASEVG